MFKTYYSVCLTFLLIITDAESCRSSVRRNAPNPEHARCESDFVFNLEAGGWLKLHTTPETWEEAFLICQNEGAVLASPLTKGLAHALQLQMLQFGVSGHIYLGIHDLFSKGHFVSVEGTKLCLMEINFGAQSNGAGTGDCLTMSVDGSVRYSSCTDPLPFVCFRKPENKTLSECSTFDYEYHYNEQTGSCYKVHLDKQTWTRAYSICASEGGYLVILNDAKEARIVKDLFPPDKIMNITSEGFHLGLVAWGKDRTWFTIHGQRIEDVYNEWADGEPNNAHNMNEIRGTCYPYGTLNDYPHDMYPKKFVCEKPPNL